MRNMKQKLLFSVLCVMGAICLAGCSLFPVQPSKSKVEDVAKECINPYVKSAEGIIEKESSGVGTYVWYPMEDNRGISFRVAVDNDYISFVEPIKPFYSSVYTYTTDYKACVLEYYKNDIVEMLENANVKEYKFYNMFNGGIDLEFQEDTDLSEMADIIIQINDLLSYDYRYNDTLVGEISHETRASWESYCVYDILVKMKGDVNGKSTNIVYDTFDFSDNYEKELTYEKVLTVLKANVYMRSNYDADKGYIGMFWTNDSLYVDSEEIETNVDESDYDGITSFRVTNVPKNEGESNVGASMKYKIVSDEVILVYYSDGAHIYHKME